ncbi:MAG: hypothetical protein AAF443_08595, partial [Chlamydiota bacterium]
QFKTRYTMHRVYAFVTALSAASECALRGAPKTYAKDQKYQLKQLIFNKLLSKVFLNPIVCFI